MLERKNPITQIVRFFTVIPTAIIAKTASHDIQFIGFPQLPPPLPPKALGR